MQNLQAWDVCGEPVGTARRGCDWRRGVKGRGGRVRGHVEAGTGHAHDFEACRIFGVELWTEQAACPVT